jgi:hypothetical protein
MGVDLGVTVLFHFGHTRARQSPLLIFIGPMLPSKLKR